MKEIRTYLDLTPGKPLIKMEVDGVTYVMVLVKGAIVAASSASRLSEQGYIKEPYLLGLAFDYDKSVEKRELVIHDQTPTVPVGLYVQESDYPALADLFDR
ncbi:MAG: hypothetical protein JWP09_132 [Candidatus Taylorbacteria bacterium]|nr:hypothetical protein [Candidatus Taylorbacteria bacterium]